MKPHPFIVAPTFDQALNWARRLDIHMYQGWNYVSTPHFLRGYRDITVYLAPNFKDTRDWDQIRHHIMAANATVHYLWERTDDGPIVFNYPQPFRPVRSGAY